MEATTLQAGGAGLRPVGCHRVPPQTLAAELAAECRQQDTRRTAYVQMPPGLRLVATDHCGQMLGALFLDPAVLLRVVLLAVARAGDTQTGSAAPVPSA